jgi:hypothetical protein
MHRLMYDTDQPVQLAFSAGLLATYADLADAALVKHLEEIHGQVAWIDRGLGDPMHLATIIDVETGTHGPADAPTWYDRRHAAGARFLTTYCNQASLAEVQREMGPRPHYQWIARLDGITTVAGFTPGQTPAAVQFAGAAALGFHADASLVFQASWNPAPASLAAAHARQYLTTAESAVTSALATLAKV